MGVRRSDHQKWNLEATTGGYYVVRAVHSGKPLSVDGEKTGNGTPTVQWPRGTAQSQEWKLIQKDEGYFALQARHSGKVLAVNGEDTKNGGKLVQWTDEDKPHQQFRLG